MRQHLKPPANLFAGIIYRNQPIIVTIHFPMFTQSLNKLQPTTFDLGENICNRMKPFQAHEMVNSIAHPNFLRHIMVYRNQQGKPNNTLKTKGFAAPILMVSHQFRNT